MSKEDDGCGEMVGFAIVYLVALYLLFWAGTFFLEHRQGITLTLVGLVTVTMMIWVMLILRRSRAAKRSNAEQKHRRELASQSEQERGRRFREKLDRLLTASNRLLIDTNIWLTPGYHNGLRMLASCAVDQGMSLVMLGPEFEEIVRLKASRDRAKAAAAREAMRLVGQLQTAERLRIERMAEDHVAGAYFDRVAVRLVDRELQSGRTVTVITDDAELRIRLLGRAGEARKLLTVCRGDEILAVGNVSEPFYNGFHNKQPTDPAAAGVTSET
jgi:hypothetical protein